MAKLSELRALLGEARKATPSKARPPRSPAAAGTGPADSTAADVDLHDVFADVTPLAAQNRVTLARAQPEASAAQHLADEADALATSRYGVEPSPGRWEPGQEQEAEQTFLRKGLAHCLVRTQA